MNDSCIAALAEALRSCGIFRVESPDRVFSTDDLAAAILADPVFRAALTKALTAALVEVEEDKIGAHPECLDDSCGHTDGCPDWGALGCGDAAAIVAYLLPAADPAADASRRRAAGAIEEALG